MNSHCFYITDYFEEKAKSSMIKEIHLTSSGFLEPHFLLKYKELFPHIEKLTIDPLIFGLFQTSPDLEIQNWADGREASKTSKFFI